MDDSRRTLTILSLFTICMFAPGPLAGAWSAKPGTVKIFVKKSPTSNLGSQQLWTPISERLLQNLEAEVVLDQGAFAILQLPDASASPTLLADLGELAERRDDFDRLYFADQPLDAREAAPTFPVEWSRLTPLPGSARDAFIIQFAAPPQRSWVEALQSAGVTILDYIPQNGYIVLAEKLALDRAVETLPIQLVRLHQPFHKLSVAAREATGAFLDAEVAIAQVPEAAEALSLVEMNTIRQIRPPEPAGDRTYYRATIPTALLSQLSALPAVLWIGVSRQPSPSGEREVHLTLGSTLVSEAGGILKPALGDHRAWINSKALGGYKSVLKIGILDTGFDLGSSTDVHPDFKDSGGQSFVTVVRYTNAAGSDADCYAHGTIVAGVIAGNAGGLQSTQTKDIGSQYGDFDFYMGLGVVPEIPVVVGRVFNFLLSSGVVNCPNPPPPGSQPCFDPQDRKVIYGDLYARGVRIINNSWNDESDRTYSAESQIQDRAVRSRDGQPGDRPMIIYFSGGNNENGNQPLVSSPGTAKNVITVGGSENYNPIPYTDPFSPPRTGGTYASNGNELWSISQIGPTYSDGRIKPDLVAPASAIEAPRTRETGACRLPPVGGLIDAASPVGQQHYWSRGTSFSSPLAAGAGALLFTWFKNTTGTEPKPALMKAMQITLARDLTGAGLGRPPDAKQGWGKVDLTRAFDPAGGYVHNNELANTLLTTSGQIAYLPSVSNRYRIKDLTKPVKVTVVWTDASGSPADSFPLRNNLDLTVRFHGASGNGKYALGNDFNPTTGRSNIRTVGGTADVKNNVEQVAFTFAEVSADQFRVDVMGTAIVADAIDVWSDPPSTNLRQNFAIFIENAVENQNNASFVSQSPPPSQILGGSTFTATVSMQNTGNTTWSEANFYRLGSVAPENPFGARIFLAPSEEIAPFAPAKTFSINGQAPYAGGSYQFQWQMVEDLVQFFGGASTAITVVVTPRNTQFYTLTPCRVIDTRDPNGPYGGPVLGAGSSRIFLIRGRCGVPNTATAVSVNLTAVDPSANGYLTVYPSNLPLPSASTINFRTGLTRANNALVTLDTAGQVTASTGIPAGSTTHLVLDVNGYFQ